MKQQFPIEPAAPNNSNLYLTGPACTWLPQYNYTNHVNNFKGDRVKSERKMASDLSRSSPETPSKSRQKDCRRGILYKQGSNYN